MEESSSSIDNTYYYLVLERLRKNVCSSWVHDHQNPVTPYCTYFQYRYIVLAVLPQADVDTDDRYFVFPLSLSPGNVRGCQQHFNYQFEKKHFLSPLIFPPLYVKDKTYQCQWWH